MKLSLSIAGLLAAILLAGQNIALAASEATAPEVANDAATGTPPQSMPHYLLLERALLQYQSLAAHPDLTQLPALGRRSIKPGEAWEGAPALRRLLTAIGDLPGSAPLEEVQGAPANLAANAPAEVTEGAPVETPDPLTILDPQIVAALQHFQERHGLDTDGVLGPAT